MFHLLHPLHICMTETHETASQTPTLICVITVLNVIHPRQINCIGLTVSLVLLEILHLKKLSDI